MNIQTALAKGNGSMLRSAYRLHRALHALGLDRLVPLRSLSPAIRKLLLKAASREERVILAQINGHPMFLPECLVDRYLFAEFEPLTVAMFQQSLWPGAVVLDIGAHIGFYSLLAARAVGPEGQVFAFEPGVNVFSLLERNIQMNGYRQICALRQAVGNQIERREFILAEFSDLNSFFPNPFGRAREISRVDCVALDSFLDSRAVDVVKIDVEGAELLVLEGMRKTIVRSENMVLFVEINPACLRAAGRTPADLVEALADFGFTVSLIDDQSRRLRPVPNWAEILAQNPFWWANLYCVKGPRPAPN